MIQVYKALHDIDDIKWKNMSTLSANQTRGHHLKLVKKRCNTTQRLNTFSMRIVDHWNNLLEDTVTANSINIFKSRLNEENWNEKKFIPT